MRHKLLRRLEWLLFVLGLCFLAFSYGIAVGRYRLPPYLLIKEARSSAKELWHWAELQMNQLSQPSRHGIHMDHPHVVILDGTAPGPLDTDFNDADALTFITMFRGKRFGMFLVDRGGEKRDPLIHKWRVNTVYRISVPVEAHKTVE
jgi:hypothetical protein